MKSPAYAVQAEDTPVLLKSIGLFLLSVLLASSSAAVSKHIAAEVSTSAIVFYQYAICWLLSLPWVIRHGLSSLKTAQPGQHLLRGISGCLCFYAFYFAISKIPLVDAMLLRNAAPLLVQVVISAVIAAPFYWSTGALIPVSSLPWLLYIGVAMYLGFWLYTKAFGYVKASVLSPMNYFAVVFAALFDWGIWGKVPSLNTTVGIVLVIVGGLAIVFFSQEKSSG